LILTFVPNPQNVIPYVGLNPFSDFNQANICPRRIVTSIMIATIISHKKRFLPGIIDIVSPGFFHIRVLNMNWPAILPGITIEHDYGNKAFSEQIIVT